MTKILGTAVALLLAAVAALGWQLKGAWADAATAQQVAKQAGELVEQQRKQSELVLGRLESLDGALKGLEAGNRANAERQAQTLAAIGNITKQEGDSDESVTCLGVAVPRQLDDSLR